MEAPSVIFSAGSPVASPDEGQARRVLAHALELGLGFKLQPEIYRARLPPTRIRDLLLSGLPDYTSSIEEVLAEFTDTVLPLCKNEASPRFLGFGDTGDDVAALAGGILALFTQQNLINQSFDSPSATFIEITVLRWLRELLGFANPPTQAVTTVWDVGGIITHGGTMSNTVAMMLAREHAVPGTMDRGVTDPGRFTIIVPRGIGHYSVKSALTWIGAGSQLIEVDTAGFRYDLAALERALAENRGRVMAVVAYAGDSRTQTIENLQGVHDVTRAADERIWLHADACWGLLCAFSDHLRHKIAGISGFDSVTVDPHKVMAVPYALSALLVRTPASLRTITSYSDLIMQEDFAFGQVTPFVGTKSWLSLKLWMLMRTHGRPGLAAMAEKRVAIAQRFAALVDACPRTIRLHEPDLLAVAFVYLPVSFANGSSLASDVELVNRANRWIHERMLAEGIWHLHQFSMLDDAGILRRGATVHPLRFMAANPCIEAEHMTGVLDHVVALGRAWEASEHAEGRA
ncbi:pyridoxal phosphate-dependent decarboxylase family protein [Frankia tisae]|uniref:pyridoxal phosphate-dependent decarboxylase family protein n=1 Tax=Frankia tisae TaxID=2950104 RepID=UPI0021BFFDE4|nr:pyridoxal-dependent decarboxylase [Frankia tisae]